MIDKDSLPLDKPRRTPDHPTKSHVVKTRVDGKEKIIRFGEQGASTAGKPKQGESERMTAKRASFKSRHAKNIAKGKSSAAYWADRVKWAKGGSVELENLNSKYEGIKKPDFSLLDSFKGMIKTLQSRAEETQGQEFDPLETLKPTSAAPTLEDLYSSYAAEPAAGPAGIAGIAGIAGHAGRAEAGVTPSDALALAASQMGLSEGGQRAAIQDYLTTGGANLDPATTAWCAAFVNSTLQQTGVQGTGSNMARSFLDWGQSVDQPQEGDLAVFSRGDPSGPYGHVGFFKGYDDQGNVLVLGGNQGDAVSISPYPRESLLGFRRAGEAEPQKFAEGGLAELTQKYDRGGEVPKPERGEPETSSLTGFPEIDRMIVALGNVNQMFNPVEAIGDSMDASKRMLAPETEGWDRVAALGDMLSGVGGVVAPVATAARAGTPAAAALMESLLGGSPATTAMGDTVKDIGRTIVERANQRGPVPVMGSNFGNVLGDGGVNGSKVDFVKDNPGGDWLAKKQSYAFEYPRMKGISGAITGWMGGKSDLFLPTDVLKFIEPLNNEKRIAGDPRFDDLMSSVKKEGFDPDQKGNKIVIAVNHQGVPFILEGNTRVAVAHAMGVPSVKAEVRYWNGAEEIDGPMSPNRVSAMVGSPTGEAVADMARKYVLGDAEVTPGIEAADRIADMLRTGRADEITDELADQADPQRLMYHYTSGNTGMDLPMDQASRMERSKQMGFDTSLPLYHGTTTGDIKRFRLSPRTNDFAIYSAKDPVYANQFAGYYPDRPVSDLRLEEGSSVIPLFSKGEHGDFTMAGGVLDRKDVPNIAEMFGIDPQELLTSWDEIATESLGPNADVLPTYSFVEHSPLFKERLEELGMSGVDFLDYSSSTPYDEFETWNRATLNPADLRSKFARFDPRLGHLSHLDYAKGGTVNANFNRDRQRDDLRTIGDTVYERRADGVLSPLSRVKYAASKPAEPDTGSRTGFPEVDRMLVTLGNLNEALNPMVAIQNSQKASRRMFEPNLSGWERMAAAGDMLSNVAGVVAPAALSARAGVPAATALMESLTGGSPAAATDAKKFGEGWSDVYHWSRSPNDFTEFDPSKSTSSMSQLGPHVGTKEAANARYMGYTDSTGDPSPLGFTLPLKADLSKQFVNPSTGKPWSEIDLEMLVSALADEHGVDRRVVAPIIRDRLAREGYTSIPYVNDVEDAGNISHIMLTERPSSRDAVLRSRFAKFDPSMRNMKNLSAGVAAGAVGLEAAQYDPDQVDTIADTVRKREFATGGAVKYDPAAVDNIINQIREVNRG